MIPPRDLLVALVNGDQLETAVPQALEFVSRDPLTIVHSFRGDLLRGLMEIPACYSEVAADDELARVKHRTFTVNSTAEKSGRCSRFREPLSLSLSK